MTTRNRSRTLYAEPYLREKVLNWPALTTYSDKGTPDSKSISETMTDELSPGYFSKRKRGQFLPINPMSSTKTTFVADSGAVSFAIYYNGTQYYQADWSGTLGYSSHYYFKGNTMTPSYTGTTPSWPSVSPILTEALANARSRGFDILTFLAEFRKTVKLITQFRDRTLKRASQVADSITSGPTALQAFAETWLESRYGWRLLIYDIEAINEAIYRLNQAKPPFIRGYATDSASGTYSLDYAAGSYMNRCTPALIPSFNGQARITIDQVKTREVRCGAVLEALIDDIIEIDPLVTGWEVIPFSFILDWFVNVGDVVTAYSPFATENLLGAWSKSTETLETRCLTIPTTTGNPTSGWYYQASSSVPYTSIVTNQTVSRVSESPSANLSFRINLDELKVVDLASIFFAGWGRILGKLLKSNRI